MIDDEAHAELLSQLRSRLTALATDHGALVRETNNAAGWYWPGTGLVLEPTAAGATRVTVFPEDAYTVWVEFGHQARVEIAVEPEHVPEAVGAVVGVVEAVVAGRARQRLWYARGQSELVGHEDWVEMGDGGQVRRSSDGRVPGRLGRLRHEARDVRYAPFT